jgi:hypothetical protein
VTPGTRQHLRCPGKALLDARHYLAPQMVAAVAAIGIAFVFDPVQRVFFRISGEQRSRQVEKWPDQARTAGL